uniref:Uncharacterized protein n=1 Tax=Arundo donax TaxID=35708 RepID=A0A0A9B0A8_ARUDO
MDNFLARSPRVYSHCPSCSKCNVPATYTPNVFQLREGNFLVFTFSSC